jgi:hypothetical protein
MSQPSSGLRIAPTTTRLALLATLSWLLGGCATQRLKLPNYTAPAGTPTASW